MLPLPRMWQPSKFWKQTCQLSECLASTTLGFLSNEQNIISLLQAMSGSLIKSWLRASGCHQLADVPVTEAKNILTIHCTGCSEPLTETLYQVSSARLSSLSDSTLVSFRNTFAVVWSHVKVLSSYRRAMREMSPYRTFLHSWKLALEILFILQIKLSWTKLTG